MKKLLKILVIISASVFIQSCASTGISNLEKEKIQEFSKQQSIRIYLITNKSDSILLRTPSAKFSYKKDEKWIRQLGQDMYKAVTDSAHAGAGIAAPQIGVLRQMICVQRFDKPDFPFEVYINPKITKYSVEKQECKEGCLSIPKFSAKLYARAKEISLKYVDINGNKQKEKISGFTAVIFQHEIDHLNGILFIDHLSDEQKYSIEKSK